MSRITKIKKLRKELKVVERQLNSFGASILRTCRFGNDEQDELRALLLSQGVSLEITRNLNLENLREYINTRTALIDRVGLGDEINDLTYDEIVDLLMSINEEMGQNEEIRLRRELAEQVGDEEIEGLTLDELREMANAISFTTEQQHIREEEEAAEAETARERERQIERLREAERLIDEAIADRDEAQRHLESINTNARQEAREYHRILRQMPHPDTDNERLRHDDAIRRSYEYIERLDAEYYGALDNLDDAEDLVRMREMEFSRIRIRLGMVPRPARMQERPLSPDETCPICLEQLSGSENNIVPIIPCGHWIHEECRNQLIDNDDFTCPICRGPVMGFGKNL